MADKGMGREGQGVENRRKAGEIGGGFSEDLQLSVPACARGMDLVAELAGRRRRGLFVEGESLGERDEEMEFSGRQDKVGWIELYVWGPWPRVGSRCDRCFARIGLPIINVSQKKNKVTEVIYRRGAKKLHDPNLCCPKSSARPLPYQFQLSKKIKNVAETLSQDRCMAVFHRVVTIAQIRQFTSLWIHRVEVVHELTESTSSAYALQFIGRYSDIDFPKLWSAENDDSSTGCGLGRGFSLITMLLRGADHRITAATFAISCLNPLFTFCCSHPFACGFWLVIAGWVSEAALTLPASYNVPPTEWWHDTACKISKHNISVATYCYWNLWKERIMRVFENQSMTEVDLIAN